MIIGKGHQSDQSNFPVSNDQLRLIAHAARGESNGEIGKNLPRPMNRAAVKQQMYRIGNVAGFHGRTQRYVLGAMITGQLTLDTIWPDEAPVDTQEGPTD